ncbi:N-acetylmuramoyl-L-alanine amidase [Enterococcus asini]|uniref:N-acetylmuramoyl-L-alanine amidase n=1 Tax=Enterococcus asini TaxID=57732 RepID=UPI002890C36E|nr:N-acetylmuramoyl-L-alanine amidase [Enterococcus asini]MDT2756805.1 N-acetylmuramoyl-L-alanine amidase [Enterococcus asini]
MKKKAALIFLVAGFAALVINMGLKFQADQASVISSSSESSTTTSTSATSQSSQEQTTTTVKMVKTYVDPSLYDENVESEADYVSVLATASSDGEVLTKLHRGEWSTWVADEGDFVKIKADDGEVGYIPAANAQVKEVEQSSAPTSLSQLHIVLDAGHGGIDSGAVSPDGELYEKDMTLKTVKAVGELLEENGVEVTYTRDSDEMLELSEIVERSEAAQPDVFISIHYDNFDTDNGWQGFTTYNYYQAGEVLANLVSESLGDQLSLSNNGVRTGNYYVIRENNQPVSLLLELGYLNSDEDLAEITKEGYPEKVAKGILAALKDYVAQN